MKKINPIIPAIAVAYGITMAAVAVKLVYTPGRVESKVKKVWDKYGDDITKDLGLKQKPTLAFDGERISNNLMFVESTIHYRSCGWMSRTIIGQESDNVIHVNRTSLSRSLNEMHSVLARDISEEYIIALLRHECRHLHQFENGFNVGKVEQTFQLNQDILNGYGANPGEEDANTYAISAAENKKQKLVAQLNKAIQDEAAKICPDNREARKYAKAIRSLPRLSRI